MSGEAVHPLRNWRLSQDPKLTLDAAAAAVGTVRSTWFDWESGRRIPERRFMVAVYRLTGGEIRPDDFYELPDLATPELALDPEPAPLFELPEPTTVHDDLQAAA